MRTDRFSSQFLTGQPATDVMSVVRRLLATQAQDLRGARLAIRARSAGLTTRDVDQVLDSGEAVVSWLNRGTLHLVAVEDYWWLHELISPTLVTGNARRLRQEGVSESDAERGVEVVADALRAGPMTRRALREPLAAAGVPTAGQALVHLLFLATLRGLVVRGPMRGTEQAFVLVESWLGTRPSVDRDAALAALGRRYLAGHGPADAADLSKWTGLPLRDTRAAIAAVSADTRDAGDGLVDLADAERLDEIPPPRLLGPYEPVLLGWASRAAILDGHDGLVTSNGLFRPFLLVDGRAAGTWSTAGSDVAMSPFRPLRRTEEQALAVDAHDVRRFLWPDQTEVWG